MIDGAVRSVPNGTGRRRHVVSWSDRRLSTELPHARQLGVCQACGRKENMYLPELYPPAEERRRLTGARDEARTSADEFDEL